MQTLSNGIELYETKKGAPAEDDLKGGKRLVQVEHHPMQKVHVTISAETNITNARFKVLSDEIMFSEDFEQYLLPLIH